MVIDVPKRIRFADCELDLEAHELRRDGQPCAIEPQVVDLLAHLVAHADRLITKEELIDKVWAGRIVSDSAVTSRVKAARRAIGDDGERQALIRTVRGRGLRFVGEILDSDARAAGAALDAGAADGETVLPALRSSADDNRPEPLTIPDKPSIAVLPLANLSGDPDQEYFADAVAEDIIAGLSRFRWLFVIARNSSFTFKGQSADAPTIGPQLGVRYVLDGSVRKADDRIRVRVQLVDATTGTQIWAERYDRVLQGIFAVQDEITQAIVAAIGPELGKAEQRRANLKKPESLGAWDLYHRANWHLYRRTAADLAEAERLFEAALSLDPGLSSAHSGLVDAHYYSVVLGLARSPDECRAKALAAARRAVELDPEDGAAHCAMGKARIVNQEHEAAIPDLERAIELNPSLAWAHYGLGAAAAFLGKGAEAIPHLERAIRLSPRDLHMGSFMVRIADAYLSIRDYERASEWARRALRQPSFQWSRYAVLIAALGHLGRIAEARELLEEVRGPRPDFSVSFVRQAHLHLETEAFRHYLEGLRKAGVPEKPSPR